MDILRESNPGVIQALNNCMKNINKDDIKNFRFLKFLFFIDIDDGKLIYNGLTGALVWLPMDQYENIMDFNKDIDYVHWLKDNFFIIDELFNEHTFVDSFRDINRFNYFDKNYLKSGKIRTFTVLTTTGCNARCFYCYEKGHKQQPMTSETAKKTANFIIKNAIKTGEQVELRWFGGEPLVNENIVDIICKAVQDAGFNYISTFTSNGFLFKEEKIKKYNDLWHFKSVQITLDGTEEVYNKTKNYKNIKGKSPYQIVLYNIEFLLKNGIQVSVRMNCDAYNVDNLQLLVRELHNRFSKYDKFHMYCYPIFEDEKHKRTEEEVKALYENVGKVNKVLEECGIFTGEYIHNEEPIRISHCMVDGGTSVLIGVNGDLGLCEHYFDNHFYGHIDKDEKDLNEIKVFQTYLEPYDMCYTCPLYPSCVRISLCADLRFCDKYKKEYAIHKQYNGIIKLYNDIRNEIKNVQQHNELNNKELTNEQQYKELNDKQQIDKLDNDQQNISENNEQQTDKLDNYQQNVNYEIIDLDKKDKKHNSFWKKFLKCN